MPEKFTSLKKTDTCLVWLSGIVDVFAETLAEHGICRTRLPIQENLDRCTWISKPEMEFFQEIQEQSQQAVTVFKKFAIK